jgi:hypothetical protein
MWSIVESTKRDWLGILIVASGCFFLAQRVSHVGAVRGADSPSGAVVLEDFEKHGAANFPKNWWSGGKGAELVYRIEAEGDTRYLHARAENRGVPIGLQYVFNPKKWRQLRWRWRVRVFPTGSDERRAEKHDAAAQVYVLFDDKYWPRVVKFIWSASLPEGARFNNPHYDRGRVVVLRSGPPAKAGWHEETVNFYAEYRKFFGNEPGQAEGFGILTSSDSTKSIAAADYDDFVLLP